jgi:hypothetical protein
LSGLPESYTTRPEVEQMKKKIEEILPSKSNVDLRDYN